MPRSNADSQWVRLIFHDVVGRNVELDRRRRRVQELLVCRLSGNAIDGITRPRRSDFCDASHTRRAGGRCRFSGIWQIRRGDYLSRQLANTSDEPANSIPGVPDDRRDQQYLIKARRTKEIVESESG